MSKKVKIVLAMVIMLGLAGSAQATTCWAGFSGDWANPATWLYNTGVPTAGDQALIYNGAVLNVTTAGQSVGEVAIGYPSGGATINIAAGIEWDVITGLRVGVDYASGPGTAVLNVYGTAHAAGLTVSETATSAGTINVYNGGTLKVGSGGYAINVGAAAPGAINLKGNGSMVIDGDGAWHLNLFSGRGHIDIEAGSLKVLGDYQTQLQSYVNNHWITSHGGSNPHCALAVSFLDGYTYVKTTGCTCVTYIPEDLNHDCYVDMLDIALLAQNWLVCTNPTDANCM